MESAGKIAHELRVAKRILRAVSKNDIVFSTALYRGNNELFLVENTIALT